MPTAQTLQVSIPTDREIVMVRVFDAPRHLVYDAMCRPELMRRWMLGPPGWTLIACANDMRVGGTFRHVWRGPDGTEMAMSGVYREVNPPERIVRTETFEFGCGPQAGEQLSAVVLTEQAGQTTLTLTVQYPSREARDATLASGMEHGVTASYDRLEELLATS